MTIFVSLGHGVKPIRALIDSGSQRSYISPAILEEVGAQAPDYNSNMLITTYLEQHSRLVSEQSIELSFQPNGNKITMPFIVDKNFELSYVVPGLSQLVQNMQASYVLADTELESLNSEKIDIYALLGVDVLEHLEQFKKVKF